VPYSYFEHISDIGLQASAETIERAFEEGAAAMLAVIFDLDTVAEVTSVGITARARVMELLFVEVLNELLSIQGRDELALKRLETIEIRRVNDGFIYKGTAHGEPLDRSRHGLKTEVKGATYSGLYYNGGEDGEHVLKCVIDV
jgi:tRNA nucleotidyltransferase (CCA-adding enzyme)